MDALIAFDSTFDAMLSEIVAQELKLKARLIPTPEKITASCGLALRLPLADVEITFADLKAHDIGSGTAYKININNGVKSYEKISEFQVR